MNRLRTLWNKLPDGVRRIIHTAWQVALSTLIVHLFMAQSTGDVKASFVAAGTIFLATIKASLVKN